MYPYPCCEEIRQGGPQMGSHYHCGRCLGPEITGMYGHHTTYCKITKTQREFHGCCPNACELEEKSGG